MAKAKKRSKSTETPSDRDPATSADQTTADAPSDGRFDDSKSVDTELSTTATAPELPHTDELDSEIVAESDSPDSSSDIINDEGTDRLTIEPVHAPVRGRRLIRRRIVGGLVLLIAISIGLIVWHRHQTSSMSNSDIQSLVTIVGRHALLPQGETPSVSTVVDTKKVNQQFLLNAQNGDKVLLYFQAGRAIVYRPSTGQIVNMGPVTTPPATVFLRNGTTEAIPSALSDKLTTSSGFQVASQDVAARSDYATTLVVDVKGNRPDLAAKAAKLVGGKVANLPETETAPDADILIIVGFNQK